MAWYRVGMSLAIAVVSAQVALSGGVGRLSGIISDLEGNPIAGAKLTFVHVQQGFEREVVADAKGKFLISTLPYGDLKLTISADGFASYREDIKWVPELNPWKHDYKLAPEGAARAAKQAVPVEGLTTELAKALDEANAAKLGEDFAKAAAIYETARQTSGDHPILLMGLAECYLRSNDSAKAVAVLQQALKLDPPPTGAHFYLGAAYSAAGQNEQAVTEFKTETELTPDNDRAFYNLGAVQYQLGKKNEAIAALVKARELNPDNAEAGSLLSQLYVETGQVDKAKTVVAKGGGDPTALLNMGIGLYNDHKDREALDAFKQLIAADPESAKGHKMLGLTYVRLGDLENAKVSLRKAVSLDGKDQDAKQMLSELGG